MKPLTVAVEGCLHGELDALYQALEVAESSGACEKIDLLLICGDFQSLVDTADMSCIAMPDKYKKMGEFRDYVSGVKKAHCPTVFVGGNHEASNILQSLYYGGYVAPDIYFMGYAGCINFRGLRIGGISGIYNHRHYQMGHYEVPPYNADSLRSVYHIRELEVLRLSKLSRNRMDVMMSHDWPQGVWNYGNVEALLRKKSFLRDDMQSGRLGCAPLMTLMATTQPKFWFAAHLHCKFAAVVPWAASEEAKTSGGGDGSLQAMDVAPVATCSPCNPVCTRFLALDKVLPGRDFLQLLSLEPQAEAETEAEDGGVGAIEYDPEWLAILRKTHHLLDTGRHRVHLPTSSGGEGDPLCATEEEVEQTRALMKAASEDGTLRIPGLQAVTTAGQGGGGGGGGGGRQGNAQTDRLLGILGLPHIWTLPLQPPPPPPPPPPPAPMEKASDTAEINIDDL